jgi:hypothetical protein
MVLHRPVEAAGIIGMWESAQLHPKATFRYEDLSGLGPNTDILLAHFESGEVSPSDSSRALLSLEFSKLPLAT